MPEWGQKLPDEVTQSIPQQVIDSGELDSNIFKVSDSLEELLIRFVVILHDRSKLGSSNRRLQELLKRYIIAVVAVSCIEKDKLDHVLELNVALPKLHTDGVGELVSYIDDISDFYSYVNAPDTATTTVEVFEVELKR